MSPSNLRYNGGSSFWIYAEGRKHPEICQHVRINGPLQDFLVKLELLVSKEYANIDAVFIELLLREIEFFFDAGPDGSMSQRLRHCEEERTRGFIRFCI